VKHIRLDAEDDRVKQFFRTLPVDPRGSVLELEGRAVACLLPAAPEGTANGRDEWTEAKNTLRCDLIDREIAGTLKPGEAAELHRLQQEMLRHRRRVAPLPLDDARRLHQQLLAQERIATDEEYQKKSVAISGNSAYLSVLSVFIGVHLWLISLLFGKPSKGRPV
jgi:hypothetical protein